MQKWLLFLLISLPAWSTVFSLQTIDQQLTEADGVVIGHFLKSKAVKLESGKIATQMVFKVQKEWGMQSDLFGIDEMIIHYPGGKLGDQNVQVQGVPRFVIGEKIALLTKNVDNRSWGLNLGFGSFKIINYGNQVMLVNTLFPMDQKVGQVKWESFEEKLKAIKGSNLKVVNLESSIQPQMERVPASAPGIVRQKRAVASNVDQVDNNEDHSSLGVYWLIAILGLAGGLSRLIRVRDV
jgi:hypothetical protein